MNYYYDTEFLEGTQKKKFVGVTIGETKPTIDLISIGIVAEDGREYYAISKDFNLKEAWNRNDLDKNHKKNYKQKDNYWIRENVLRPIFREFVIRSEEEWFAYSDKEEYEEFLLKVKNGEFDMNFNYKHFKKLLYKYGKTNNKIAEEVHDFIMETGIDYGVGPHQYTPINLYGYYSAYDHVVFCWLFGKMMDLPNGFPMYTKDLKQIMDEKALIIPVSYTLDEVLKSIKLHSDYPKQENEHNALCDARFAKDLHYFLQNL